MANEFLTKLLGNSGDDTQDQTEPKKSALDSYVDSLPPLSNWAGSASLSDPNKSLGPSPDVNLDEKAYQMAGGDSNPRAQQDMSAIADRLRDERNKAPLPDDGGFVKNILMNGVFDQSASPLSPGVMAANPNQTIAPSGPNKIAASSVPKMAKSSAPETQPQSLPALTPAADPTGDMLRKLMASAGDDTELRDAMKQQQREESMAMMMRGAINAQGGLSGQSSATAGPDYLKEYVDSGKQNVSNVKDLMKGKQEKIKFAMDTEKGMLDIEKARDQMTDTKSMQDPNSDISKAWRETARTRFKLAGVNVPANLISDKLPASKVKELFPSGDIVDDLIKLKGVEEARATRHDTAAEKEYANLNTMMVTPRRGTSAAQSQNDLLNISKSKELINEFKLSGKIAPEKFALLVAEVAKIGTGGVPHEGTMKVLNTPSAGKAIAGLKRYVGATHVDARANDLMREYGNYLDDLEKVSTNNITNYYKQLLQGRKGMLKPEHLEELRRTNPEMFSDSTQKTQGYPPNIESGIKSFMNAHPGMTRDNAIGILKGAGKI